MMFRYRKKLQAGGVIAVWGIFIFHSFTARAADLFSPFSKTITPLLKENCFKCHNAEKKKGGVDFSSVVDEKSILRQRKMWVKAAAQVQSGEMPPDSEEPLSPAAKAAMLEWMKAASIIDCGPGTPIDPGPTLIRRLNRAEYERTLHDLLGIDFDASQTVGMQEDVQAKGFSNQVNGLILPAVLMEKYFAAADRIVEMLLEDRVAPKTDGKLKKQYQAAYDALFSFKPGGTLSKRDAARKTIETLARRAYRRPVRPDEIDRLMRLFDKLDAKGEPFDKSVMVAVKGILVSPNFLFRVEQDHPNISADQAYPVSDHELASRLSYFLWSSMPDAELFSLADQNKLSDPAVLEAQIRRMLAHPRAKALTEQFAVQWLQLGKVAIARPSTEFFPTFKEPLKQAMYDETALFFDNLRIEDRSIVELLDCDYTFLNADLAKHYGIDGVQGKEMRKVQLKPEANRGGLLGMGSVLALTSHTSRTSPTLRGKYILEVIFGTPPPPPPPDAGMLKEDKAKGKEPKSFREQMAQHASNATCAACHKRIDPLGFGLENFNAVGQWRADAGGGRKLDTTGQLPTGEKFDGASELKKIILSRKDEFVHNVTEQMFIYALGRDLDYFDECAVKQAVEGLQKDNYRFSSLIAGVVKSSQFRYRKNTDAVSR